MQALLAEHAWDWTAALAALQRFILAGLGDPEAIVVLDETAELKKGTATVGVGRQHAGITGQVENCQTVVFAAYVTARAHALFDFRLYLPKQWCQDKKRRQRAHVPDDVAFTTKPALGTAMLTAAASAGVPFDEGVRSSRSHNTTRPQDQGPVAVRRSPLAATSALDTNEWPVRRVRSRRSGLVEGGRRCRGLPEPAPSLPSSGLPAWP